MDRYPGVFSTAKKDGTQYFRASLTYRGKHISLGSFTAETEAHEAYRLAQLLLFESRHFDSDPLTEIENHSSLGNALSFDKWVMLLNFRDHGMYCRNPIYLAHRFFYYCLDADTFLKFDVDDLFYYMKHKIMRRGGHLFVADYGMQVNLLSRYGIKNFAVPGRDYRFANRDPLDFRYGNIEIINRYHGVSKQLQKGQEVYTTRIHVNGDRIVGRYATEEEAAVAYNKAADLLRQKGSTKQFPENFVDTLDEVGYARLYHKVRINPRLVSLQM